MIKQGSTSDLRSGKIKRDQAYVVVTMRYYPRGLSKDLSDEFVVQLAPDKDLLKDWQDEVARTSHDQAFASVDYLKRFQISALGFAYLKRFAHLAKTQIVYFICQCEVGEMCHREILMKIVSEVFQTPTDPVHHDYSEFMRRIPELLAQAQFDPTLDYRE